MIAMVFVLLNILADIINIIISPRCIGGQNNG